MPFSIVSASANVVRNTISLPPGAPNIVLTFLKLVHLLVFPDLHRLILIEAVETENPDIVARADLVR